MEEARLVYKKVQSASEYDGANVIIRAYVSSSGFSSRSDKLCADVIYTQHNQRVVTSFTNPNPAKLAEAVADFANERIIECDLVWCTNELPERTQAHPNCANRFKEVFCAEIEAITDHDRNVRRAKKADTDRFDRWAAPYRERNLQHYKKEIFGE